MSFLKSIFNKKDESIETYDDFWNWFQNNAKTFYNVVKSNIKILKRNFLTHFSQS